MLFGCVIGAIMKFIEENMKHRFLDPELRRSESVSKLSFRQRDLWYRLILSVDDQGRMPGHPGLVRADAWPLDDVPLDEVQADLETLQKQELIIIYESEKKRYIQLLNWKKYQNGAEWLGKSDYPAPDGWEDRFRYHGKGREVIESKNWKSNAPTNGPAMEPIIEYTETSPLPRDLFVQKTAKITQTSRDGDVNDDDDVKDDKEIKGSSAAKIAAHPPNPELQTCAHELASVCRMDLESNRGRIFKTAREVIKIPGYTTERMHIFRRNWYRIDFRGKKNEPPTPEQVKSTWLQYAGEPEEEDRQKYKDWENTQGDPVEIVCAPTPMLEIARAEV